MKQIRRYGPIVKHERHIDKHGGSPSLSIHVFMVVVSSTLYQRAVLLLCFCPNAKVHFHTPSTMLAPLHL